VLRDSHLLAMLQDGLRRIGAPAARAVPVEEAMSRLVGPGPPPLGLLLEPNLDSVGWKALLTAAHDPFSPTRVLLIGGADGLPAEPDHILAALRTPTVPQEPSADEEVAAFRLGLVRGELAMRYQPIVRISDRRPVGVEGLVRWLRPGAQGSTALGPDSFVPMAERGGLAVALSRAVGRLAVDEMAALWPGLRLPISINLPLEVILRRDTRPWLSRLCREGGLRSGELALELTETSPVSAPPALHRAVTRLRQAGHPVWIDDMSLQENRDTLLDMPFTGIKLDRHLVGAMPRQHRARAEVTRLVALAHARGMLVTAEGVTSEGLWRTLAAAGVDRAQGFAVGRPLPATALPAWVSAWRATRRVGRNEDGP
jgi:EAL domain-containing protein (putative c-di-GMP-specific phosphodiesterase class I)